MLYIRAEYETDPEFKFHAFVGKLGEQERRWTGDGDPVKAFYAMEQDMLRDGVYPGGKWEDIVVMWSSSMTHLVMDTNLAYVPGTVEVDGTGWHVDQLLMWLPAGEKEDVEVPGQDPRTGRDGEGVDHE